MKKTSKKVKSAKRKAKRKPQERGDRKAFEQLLDDAIFGVKPKDQRGLLARDKY